MASSKIVDISKGAITPADSPASNIAESPSVSLSDIKTISKNLSRQNLKLAEQLQFNTKQNLLLAAAPASALDLLQGALKLVYVAIGETIYSPGISINHVYFPVTCVVSLHYVTESGASAETASVGKEGLVGVNVVMGADSTPSSATVLIAGYAYKLECQLLKRLFNQDLAFQQLILRYIQVLFTQIAQTAVCNRHHTIEQQLSRWLLLTVDRLSSNELSITQELVSGMLGVRRESITQAASLLQREGLISYRRGHIAVLDHKGLQKHACECYIVVQNELKRLLPPSA